jgi:hypothetical protein
MFRPYEAIITQLLNEGNNMLLLHVIIFENVHSHFPHAGFMCSVHVVFLVRGFRRSCICPLYYKRDTCT